MTADFLQINPNGVIPVLITPSKQILTQSLAILEWIEESYPQNATLPPGPEPRAAVRAIALAILSGRQPFVKKKIFSLR